MLHRWLALILSVCLFAFAPHVHAAPDKGGQSVSPSPRRHLTNIVFAGLAGAILGLSTLSFYGRPQDKLSNIAVGFAIGIIGGTLYTTYKAAAEPHEFYSVRQFQPEAWKVASRFDRPTELPLPSFAFTF
jgi:hypothetical protein